MLFCYPHHLLDLIVHVPHLLQLCGGQVFRKGDLPEDFLEGFVVDIDEAGDKLIGVFVGVGGADNDNDDDRAMVSKVDVAPLRYDFDDVMVIGFDVEFPGMFDNFLNDGFDGG